MESHFLIVIEFFIDDKKFVVWIRSHYNYKAIFLYRFINNINLFIDIINKLV